MHKSLVFCRTRSLVSILNRGIQFEPPYLDVQESDVPTYPLLNIQLKGYDFSVLERFSRWVYKTATNMDVEVNDSWAAPCQKLEVVTYLKHSSVVQNSYNLQIYERNLQIEDLPATTAPLLFEVIKMGLPEGVELSIHEHMLEHWKERKIPDLHLKEIKEQLEELRGGPPKK